MKRNGSSETPKVPLNSHLCKYESFKREYKIVAIDAMILLMIYFNCGNKSKTKKIHVKILTVNKLGSFHAGLVAGSGIWQAQALTKAKVRVSGSIPSQFHTW